MQLFKQSKYWESSFVVKMIFYQCNSTTNASLNELYKSSVSITIVNRYENAYNDPILYSTTKENITDTKK